MRGNNFSSIEKLHQCLSETTRERIDQAAAEMVKCKNKGQKIVAVTGSGPNIHEGVTTLLAELIHKKIIDGVLTSSAVVAHEMAGSLDKVKRVRGENLGVSEDILPKGGLYEVSIINNETLNKIKKEMAVDDALMQRAIGAPGEIIIKAAGNLGYPVGLRTEKISCEIEKLAGLAGRSFEYIAGLGADKMTMIGAGAMNHVPVMVTVPQLVGGGMAGLAIGDSISIAQRSMIIARVLAGCSMIIESGIALSQEIHDGPFETYTGHGIWSAWQEVETFRLKNKKLVRIDLDPNLEKVWKAERKSSDVQKSVDKGLPKTKALKVPFRMEMSGFARLEGSIPIVEDLGIVWPVLVNIVCRKLGVELDFSSYPQETQQGKEMREWIVSNVGILDMKALKQNLRRCTGEEISK
ncbi:MAG: hypothetical protein ACOC7U_08740 [Spirochaetota bacterium]